MKPESKTYRHLDNPEEKRFHDAAKQIGTPMLSTITLPLNDRGTAPSRYLNEDEEQLVINTLQWLGSPVGQNFLRDMGYVKDPDLELQHARQDLETVEASINNYFEADNDRRFGDEYYNKLKLQKTELQWQINTLGKKLEPQKPPMTDKDRKYVVRHAKKNYYGTWNIARETSKDDAIKKECEVLGYTLADFYAGDGKFLNKILDR